MFLFTQARERAKVQTKGIDEYRIIEIKEGNVTLTDEVSSNKRQKAGQLVQMLTQESKALKQFARFIVSRTNFMDYKKIIKRRSKTKEQARMQNNSGGNPR